MTEFDRFVEFLRREAASYNEPPAVPGDEMWGRIEQTMAETHRSAIGRGAVGGARAGGDALESVRYNEPPATPREAMWERIDAAWSLRRAAPASVREAGLDELEPLEAGPRSSERRSVAVWITGVAVAASLIVGVVLGRGLLGPAGVPQVASAPDAGDSPPPEAIGDADVDPTLDPSPVLIAEPLETSGQLAADITPQSEPSVTLVREFADPPPPVTDDRLERRAVAARYATSQHLGNAATLLTAFRADGSAPEAQTELAQWARRLLGDTRLLLDMDVRRSPQQRTLLEDLELVLAQIARLGPGAADFEHELIQEGIEHQATLTRLHAATQVGT